MVRFDFNKGTLANEHIEFYRSRGQQKQKLWCQKLDTHTAEADWKQCSFAMRIGHNSLNWKCFLSQLNSRVKMTAVDVVLSLGHFRAIDSRGCTPGHGVCVRCPGPGRGSGPFAVPLFRTRGLGSSSAARCLPTVLPWARLSIPSSCLEIRTFQRSTQLRALLLFY